MLKVANRESQGFLDIKDIEKFPCSDLHTIDQLWVQYSDGRFGFSVQKRIYEAQDRDWEKVYRALEWEYTNYSIKAPVGHLPQGTRFGVTGIRDSSFAHRLVDCNL